MTEQAMPTHLVPVQLQVGIPAGDELLRVVTVRRTPDGKLSASAVDVPGAPQPKSPVMANLLRWMADAYDIESLSEDPDA